VDWHCHDVDFQLFFILRGALTIETQDREEVVLFSGGAGCVPRRYWHREYDFSDDCEIVMVSSPADLRTLTEPMPDSLSRTSGAIYTSGSPDEEVAESVGRAFSYRELGGGDVTEGRITTRVVRVRGHETEPRQHALVCRWTMILEGRCVIDSDDMHPIELGLHDSLTLGADQRVRQTAASGGYVALEISVQPEQKKSRSYESTDADSAHRCSVGD
jgi:hypothetical protein